MKAFSNKPTYNLKAVLEITGIKADALRAWERRYGLPEPQRSSGKQRLYSQKDIEIIKWLIARQDEGLRISQAVESWKTLQLSGLDPLDDTPILKHIVKENATVDLSGNMDELRDLWIMACITYNESLAEDILNQAFALSPVAVVCTQLLQKGLREMGEKWYHGEISAQQEHFASALCVRRLEALISATPRPQRTESIFMGCAPREWHTLPVLMMNLLLRRRGINIIYLGANTPSEQLVDTVQRLAPQLVILSAQQLSSAVGLREVFSVLNDQGFNLAYGGLIFNRIPALRRFIPAHFLGEEILQSIENSEALLLNPQPGAAAEDIPAAMQKAAFAYLQKRSLIEAQILQAIDPQVISADNLNKANHYLGDGIISALQAGDINFLDFDIAWAQKLPGAKSFFANMDVYFQTAPRVINDVLGSDGQVIANWFKNYRPL